MPQVSLFRLYLLRATYLFVVVGLGLTIWPPILNHTATWPLMNGVVCSLLAGVSILAALGIRYPLQMLPVLLFELIWKSTWLIAVALPLWFADRMTAESMATVIDCLVGVILMPIVIPWGYVISNYLKRPGDPWGRNASSVVSAAPQSTVAEKQ